MPERRRSKRTKMILPVKVTVAGSKYLAHTFDLTYSGARLGGLHTELKKGQIISLQRGSKKADFRVVWVQELGPNEIHAGVQAVREQSNNFWGVDLSEQERESKSNMDALMAMMAPRDKS